MAILCDADGEYLSRTTSLPASTAFSICGTFKIIAVDGASPPPLFLLADSGLSDIVGCFYNSLGEFYVYRTNSYIEAMALDGVLGSTYFVGLTTDATTLTLYVGEVGSSAALSTATVSAKSFTVAYLQVFATSDWRPNATVAGVKAWDATLTAAEIERERCVLRPVRTADLHLWTPMLASSSASDAAKDYSGSGRDWTVNGSPTITDGPPVGWGAPIWIPQYTVASGIPVLSSPSMSSITATTGVPRVTLTF